ncbi:MAG: hypothetical protein KDC57_20445 [Saprospiraceae bacterium]|nr:hypothetical protein [Saprospiraceae bacterium]
MSNAKLLTGMVISAVFVFLIDYVFYGLLMADSLTIFPMREMPNFLFLIIAYLILGLFFTHLAGKYHGALAGVSPGFIFGLIVGFLVFATTTLIRYATEPLDDFGQVLITLVFDILKMGVLGAILALILGKSVVGDRGKTTGGGH